MKKLALYLFLLATLGACAPQNSSGEGAKIIKPEKNDEGDWDLQVIDSQYEYFLNAIAKPMSMYTESYLKSYNATLVSEWNSYYYSGRYRNVVESPIEYNPQEKYGIAFEYRLFQVFVYAQWKYHLRMNSLPMGETLRVR